MMKKQDIEQILNELPNEMPEGEALLALAEENPLAVALHQIVKEIGWWVERGKIHRTTLLVKPERSQEIVEALVDGKWRHTEGCRCIEFSIDEIFSLPTPTGESRPLYLQVDSGMLTVSDDSIMPEISWIEEDYHPFMCWN